MLHTIKCFRSNGEYLFFEKDAQLINEIAKKPIEVSPTGKQYISIPVAEIYDLRDRALNFDLFFQIS